VWGAVFSAEVLDLLLGRGEKGRRWSSGRLVGGIDAGHFSSGRGEDGAGRRLMEGERE
jgi:hypothetical protein